MERSLSRVRSSVLAQRSVLINLLRSGFLLTSALDRCYASEAQSNLEQLSIRNQILPTQADVNALYPQVKPTIPDNHFNYVNHEAGSSSRLLQTLY